MGNKPKMSADEMNWAETMKLATAVAGMPGRDRLLGENIVAALVEVDPMR
jgi:hypothetical protein